MKSIFSFSALAFAVGAVISVYANADNHTTFKQTIYIQNQDGQPPMLTNINQGQSQGRVYYQGEQIGSPTPTTEFTATPAPAMRSSYTAPAVLGIATQHNYLQNANARTLGQLLAKYKSGQPISIAHFGDSHVQPGTQVAPVRQALQALRGDGGRGMIFPYKMAKTYSQEDYGSHFSGSWRTANSIQQPPRIGVGVSGFVGVTQDSFATFGFTFKQSSPNLGNITATAYIKASGQYEIRASNGTTFDTKIVQAHHGTQLVPFNLPNTGKTLDFTITRMSNSGEFELHGINLDNANTAGGVTYHNLGVGGAGYKALLQQRHFNEQFPTLNADLVILDWGTNDILYKNAIADDLESTIRSTIARVRAINPNVAILLTSVQETRYKGSPTTSAEAYANLVRHIAQTEGVLFYDWYAISGGRGAMRTFQDTGYANPKDSIHLNSKGYRVKGELFADALVHALEQF